MAISNQQLVTALINHYRAKGIDLASVVDSPIFNRLPPEAQIQALRENASAIATGGNGITRDEMKSAAKSLAIRIGGGAAMGMAFNHLAAQAQSAGAPIPARPLPSISAALLGAVGMGVSPVLETITTLRRNSARRSQVAQYAKALSLPENTGETAAYKAYIALKNSGGIRDIDDGSGATQATVGALLSAMGYDMAGARNNIITGIAKDHADDIDYFLKSQKSAHTP